MRAGATTCRESIHHTGRMLAGGRTLCVMTTEELLVSRLRSRDEEAFDAVVTEQHGALIRMAMRYVANRETAEEVVQETWIAMIQGLSRFEGRSSLHAWICAILVHKAKDRGVREKRQITFSDFEYETDDRPSTIDPSRYQHCRDWLKRSTFPLYCWEDRTPEALLASQQAVA
jgi:RNA polymerase sigma-70 factor, ECF subfamily